MRNKNRDGKRNSERDELRCERNRRGPADEFFAHIRNDKCKQCLELFERLARVGLEFFSASKQELEDKGSEQRPC